MSEYPSEVCASVSIPTRSSSQPYRGSTELDIGTDSSAICGDFWYRRIFETTSEGIVVVDHRGRIKLSNGRFAQLLGVPVEAVAGTFMFNWCWPEDRRPAIRQFRHRKQGQTTNYEVRLRCHDGKPRWVLVSGSPIQDEIGRFRGSLAMVTDIDERKRMEQILAASEERYALAARGASDGLWDWDLLEDRIYFSPRWKQMIGCGEHDISDRPDDWLNRVSVSDSTQLQADLALHLAGQTRHFQNEHRLLHVDGRYRWMLVRGLAVRDNHGRPVRMAGSMSDVTQRREAEEQLRLAAQTDRLTGLPNRSVLMDRLNLAINRSMDNPQHRYAVLYLDFDRFKLINDSLGHTIGDQFLCEIAKRLRYALNTAARKGTPGTHDLAARLGGDEFVLLLDGLIYPQEPEVFAVELQRMLSEPYRVSGHDVFATVSIGIVDSQHGYQRAEDAIRDADTAMYHAKNSGKARHAVFDRKMHESVADRLSLENDLRRVVERGELELHYQPIIALDSGQLHGLEALIRWRHPVRGMVSPAQFIPIAEETGLIVPIGDWVFQTACQQIRDWRKQFPLLPSFPVSVNLSRRQLYEPDLVRKITHWLRQKQVDPAWLKVEITESALVQDIDRMVEVMQQIRTLGVGLHMDDFGTGYSSLACLHRFPLECLKVDRAFVASLGQRRDYAAVVHAIVALAHNLNMTVVAEGVETQDQVVQLQALECDLAQGYYFAKPAPASDIEPLFHQQAKFFPAHPRSISA